MCSVASVPLEQITKLFSYFELVRSGTIPDLKPQIPSIPTRRYPKFVYASDAKEKFHSFMLKTLFEGFGSEDELTAKWMGFSGTDIIPDVNYVRSLFNFIHTEVNKIPGGKYFNMMKYSEGSPNIVTNLSLYSPANGVVGGIYFYAGINDKIEDILFILLSQKAILDRTGPGTVNTLLILLPLHSLALYLNVSGWRSEGLYSLLIRNILPSLTDEQVQTCIDRSYLIQGGRIAVNLFGNPCQIIDRPEIGGHLSLEADFQADRPFQTFIGNPKTVETLSDAIIPRLLAKRPAGGDVQWFVHAAYLINLANPASNSVNRLISEIRIGNAIGAKGVVFHVGKFNTEPYNTALQNMINGMRQVLQFATEATPLLIETPAGQGAEMGASFEGFCQILDQFPNELGRTLRVCVDTCHVFALGYNPLDFIRDLWDRYPGRNVIALVHFNDSQTPRGSRIDRHQRCPLGYIGRERMMEAYEFCKEKGIPMIIE